MAYVPIGALRRRARTRRKRRPKVQRSGPTPREPAPAAPRRHDDESILVLVDEAHRSHGSALHAALLQALPNCARIGFTGTPIIMGAKKRTHEIFGEFIERYTLEESEADGATVPILYEGRYAKGAVADAAGLDDELAEMFPELTSEEREALKRKHGTLHAVLEAEEAARRRVSADSAAPHVIVRFGSKGKRSQEWEGSPRALARPTRKLHKTKADRERR